MKTGRLAILAAEQSWYYRQLSAAAQRQGLDSIRIEFPTLSVRLLDSSANANLDDLSTKAIPDSGPWQVDFDSALVRTMPVGSLEQVIFRMDVLRCWEDRGVKIINPTQCLETSIDKLLTLNAFRKRQVPFPETYACQTSEQAWDAFARLDQDVVVKPVFGGEGRGIIRVCEPEMAHRVFKTLEVNRSVIYCQRFISDAQKDLRILFIGENNYSVLRSNSASWMSNASQGGTAEPYDPQAEELDIAWQASLSVQGKVVGVDLIQDGAGRWTVLEVNAVPGWQLLQKVTGVCIADEIISALVRSTI